MRIIDSEEEYLVDLKWSESLPENLLPPVQSSAIATANSTGNEQVFQLTGWRGAGWHMVFPEEPTR